MIRYTKGESGEYTPYLQHLFNILSVGFKVFDLRSIQIMKIRNQLRHARFSHVRPIQFF